MDATRCSTITLTLLLVAIEVQASEPKKTHEPGTEHRRNEARQADVNGQVPVTQLRQRTRILSNAPAAPSTTPNFPDLEIRATAEPFRAATDVRIDAREAPLALHRLPGRPSLARAFERTLRDESERFLSIHPWANPTAEMMTDDGVLRSRSRVAERVLREAADASLEVALGGAMERRSAERLARTGHYMGLSLDTSPSWTIRRRTATSSVRLDLPLVDDALRVRWMRHVSRPKLDRVGSGVAVDPWDESVRVVFTLGW